MKHFSSARIDHCLFLAVFFLLAKCCSPIIWFSSHCLHAARSKPSLTSGGLGRLWPNRLWPILVFLVFWPTFLNPKSPPKPQTERPTFRLESPNPERGGSHPSGPLRTRPTLILASTSISGGVGVVVVVGLDSAGPPSAGPPKKSLLFFSPATVSLFFCLSGCLLVDFRWCF